MVCEGSEALCKHHVLFWIYIRYGICWLVTALCKSYGMGLVCAYILFRQYDSLPPIFCGGELSLLYDIEEYQGT